MIDFLDARVNDGLGKNVTEHPAVWSPPSVSQIRIRAYQLFESNGRAPGQSLTNWLVAESQLRRDSLQAFCIAQERARRRSTFPRTLLRDADTGRLAAGSA